MIKKKKLVKIREKDKFILYFRKCRSNFDFFQKWLQKVKRSRKRLKKTYEVKFCFMHKEISYIRNLNTDNPTLEEERTDN